MVRRAVRAGVVAGIAIIYLSMVGMVEKFQVRNLIHDVVTLARVMIALPPFMAGYLAVRPRVRRGTTEQPVGRAAYAIGASAGAIGGGITIAAVAFTHLFPEGAIRSIFVSVSPALLTVLTFGQGLPIAAAILILGGAALGLVGAVFRLLPTRLRKALAVGLIVTFSVALLQKIIPQMFDRLGLVKSWLYSDTYLGLTRTGAAGLFVVSTGLALAWMYRGQALSKSLRSAAGESRMGPRAVGGLVLLGILALIPPLTGSVISQSLGTVAIFLLMGLGLNIVVGYAGLLDLGYVAFFAVGAYFTALFTGATLVTSLGATANPSFVLHLNFYAALPLVVLMAAFTGLLIGAPVLRLRGDYLAIVTLGFGEIARVLITSDWLSRFDGGAQGLQRVTDAGIAGLSFRNPEPFYYLALAFCMLAVYVSYRLYDSRVGRAWSAMREDEQVAEAMGVSTIKYKLLAFAIGASVGCLSGALFAVQIGSLTPVSFNILVSITALSIIILGGMGSIPGVIVGAIVLIGLPTFLDEFEEFRLLIYGAVLVGIMLLRPQGLIPNVRRMRELQEEEVEQDAWVKRAGEAGVPAGIGVGAAGNPE
jgi:branched-chain amino acid transport system permease protein